MQNTNHAGESGAVRTLIAAGLIVGMLHGFSGSFVPQGIPQNTVYAFNELLMAMGSILYAARLIATE